MIVSVSTDEFLLPFFVLMAVVGIKPETAEYWADNLTTKRTC
jgi:hypothetical protein